MSISKIGTKCCSCRACLMVCPVTAISSILDEDGYEQVEVNAEKCIECGLCEKVCPILTIPQLSQKEPLACGASRALDKQVKFEGSSGGLFGIFAKAIIMENGVVYGAAFDDSLNLRTTRVEQTSDLKPLFKSKYLLCNTGNSLRQIKTDLESDRKVLYCSTPCQIAALKNYLRKDYAKLITIEFVCHGVGSQHLFSKSIEYLERKHGVKISHYEFRYKAGDATSHYYYYSGEKKGKSFVKTGLYLNDPYYNAYCKQWVCRDICYKCPYAQESRVADITIGDFHTINRFMHDLDRFGGISMYRCNTPKGASFFNSIENKVEQFPFDWDVIKKENRFNEGGEVPIEKELLLKSIKQNGFDRTVRSMLNPLCDIKRLVFYHLPLWLRKKITSL